MARNASDKKKLKDKAKDLIAGNDNVEIAPDETTGEDDFKYEQSPNVCGVVVDQNSGLGYAQITGGGKDTEIIYTGRGHTGFIMADITSGRICMLFGRPTVLYIQPRS